MERNHEQPDVWHYGSHRKPTLRERIWEALSSRVAFIVLAIVTLVMLAIALSLGVKLIG
jgi:hypothetical protein